MEKFKTLDELTNIDRRHLFFREADGSVLDIEVLHENLAKEVLNDEVPDEIKGQFNLARNMLFSHTTFMP